MERMSVVIRLKVPTEMHYTVIPMGTSKVNSSPNWSVIGRVTFISFLIYHTYHLLTTYLKMQGVLCVRR